MQSLKASRKLNYLSCSCTRSLHVFTSTNSIVPEIHQINSGAKVHCFYTNCYIFFSFRTQSCGVEKVMFHFFISDCILQNHSINYSSYKSQPVNEKHTLQGQKNYLSGFVDQHFVFNSIWPRQCKRYYIYSFSFVKVKVT